MNPSPFQPPKSKRDPKMIGLWKVGRTLGKGNSGHVRIARHSRTGQYAAIKIISKSNLPSRVSLNRVADEIEHNLLAVEREIVVMKLLDHPNIMKLYDVWETSTNLYLILEYIQGGELFEHLCSRGPSPLPEAISYFQQIICAVDYCHRFNIAHRDLKLENILIDKDSNIKVADFGMATWQDRPGQKMLRTSCGSPHYAAPEVVSGKPYNGPPADIWSCGVILYALIIARLPFDDDDCATVLRKISVGKYHMPNDVDPQAKDLIARMLTLDVVKRISILEIFRHPFFTSQPFKNPHAHPYFDMENIAQPIGSLSSIDPDIFANLRTLWHGTPDPQIMEALMNSERNWQKGIYHLLVNYRKRYLSTRDVEEEDSQARTQRRKDKQAQRATQPPELVLPPRVLPPTPRRAMGRNLESPSELLRLPGFGKLPSASTSSMEVFVHHPTSPTDGNSRGLPTLTVPELEDPKIHLFFQQVANHLNVLQGKTGLGTPDANIWMGSPALRDSFDNTTVDQPPHTPGSATIPPSRLPRLKEGFQYRPPVTPDIQPLSVRRKPLGYRPPKTNDDDKENFLQITESVVMHAQSPLAQNRYKMGNEKRIQIHATPVDRNPLNARKTHVKRSASPLLSDGGSSFNMPSPTDSCTSSPRRSWIDSVFKFKPTSYTLYSKHDVHTTRNECRRLLIQMELLVSLEEFEKLGVLKCRSHDVKDGNTIMLGLKAVKFRVELQWPTPQLCHDGYMVTLNLIQEKGSLEAFKAIYQQLSKIWTLGAIRSAAPSVASVGPPSARAAGGHLGSPVF